MVTLKVYIYYFFNIKSINKSLFKCILFFNWTFVLQNKSTFLVTCIVQYIIYCVDNYFFNMKIKQWIKVKYTWIHNK